jgi:drug/metabolite transporter (DMT)-like permease
MIPSAVNALTPFVTAAASSFIFDEQIAGIQWFGGFVSLAGTAMIIWSQGDIQPAKT